MSIINVKEDGTGFDANISTEDVSATRKFTVIFDGADDPYDRPFIAAQHADIPNIYSRHPYHSWLYVKSVIPVRVGDFYYEVVVQYGTKADRGHEDLFDPLVEPLSQPWEIEWSFAMSNEPVDRDISGNPITNSAGESFDPPLTKEISDLLLRVVRNQSNFNYAQAAQYKDAVNVDYFLGFAPGKVRCIDYSGRKCRSADLFYWQVTYEFQFREDGWKLKVFDAGFEQYDETTGQNVAIKIPDPDDPDDADKKQTVTSPWPLDGAGHALTPAQKRQGIAYFKEFEIYPKKPFSALGLY